MPKSSHKAFAPGSKPGSGARFKACTERMSHRKGVVNAKAVCATIGRRKYGPVKFQRMAAHGRKHK